MSFRFTFWAYGQAFQSSSFCVDKVLGTTDELAMSSAGIRSEDLSETHVPRRILDFVGEYGFATCIEHILYGVL